MKVHQIERHRLPNGWPASVIHSDQIHKIEKGDEDLKVRFLGIAELIAQGNLSALAGERF